MTGRGRTLAAGDLAHLLRQVHLGVVDHRVAAAGQVSASFRCPKLIAADRMPEFCEQTGLVVPNTLHIQPRSPASPEALSKCTRNSSYTHDQYAWQDGLCSSLVVRQHAHPASLSSWMCSSRRTTLMVLMPLCLAYWMSCRCKNALVSARSSTNTG